MKRIARTSFILKWLFPGFWFLVWAAFPLLVLTDPDTDELRLGVLVAMVALPLAVVLFSVFQFKEQIWSLADEVWDGGDYLRIKKGGQQQDIYLRDVIEAKYISKGVPRFSIRAKDSTGIDRIVVFQAPPKFLAEPPRLAKEILDRIERAKSS